MTDYRDFITKKWYGSEWTYDRLPLASQIDFDLRLKTLVLGALTKTLLVVLTISLFMGIVSRM